MNLRTTRGKVWLVVLIGLYSLVFLLLAHSESLFRIILSSILVVGVLLAIGLSRLIGPLRAKGFLQVHLAAIFYASLWPAYQFSSLWIFLGIGALVLIIGFVAAFALSGGHYLPNSVFSSNENRICDLL